ncbi:MAG: inositol monophosphatase [Candidatus Pacebacteria bacterium]|nr:inositol monophosphatase [Candidatus Paceibacterota bacterium]
MEPNNYLDFAKDLARDAGAIMRQNFMMGMKKEWKSDATPLTETDLKIHSLVATSIAKAYPDHTLMSEEACEDEKCEIGEYTWICDPVDGTHNFSHGIPTATFALALVKDGEPILAVINDPFMDRLYYAEKGKGAYMNDKSIHVSSDTSPKKTVMGIGKWATDILNLFPVGEELRNRGVRLVTGLSIDYMGALVAAGEFSATLFGGESPFDTVAIKLLVEEAGGKATDLFGNNTRYDKDVAGQLASNGHVHDEILEVISKYARK